MTEQKRRLDLNKLTVWKEVVGLLTKLIELSISIVKFYNELA